MCLRYLAITVGLIVSPLVGTEPVKLTADWWQAPAAATRHTTLVCSFDNGDDADSAREFKASGGFGMTAEPTGAHGAGVKLASLGGHLHFCGGSNFQASHGTVRFAVRGDVWRVQEPRWLFDARGYDRMGVLREPGKLSLVVSPQTRNDSFISRLDLPIGDVSTDAWHFVVASWDRTANRGWIALDGQGLSGDFKFSADRRAAIAVYLGGDATARIGGINLPGLAFDDFVLYDLPLPVLEAVPAALPGEDETVLPLVEQGVRRTLNFMADLQRWGGWQTLYTWPTLLGAAAQGREYVDFDDYLDNDKGNASCPLAAKFLWGYETLGDSRWLDVGLRTGEFILAAQAPEGYWLHGYRMTVRGIQPVTTSASIKLQDQVQADPILLLSYLHRLTGQQRYLDAVKRAGEFYLLAQNPNGSYTYHYDLPARQGKNAAGITGAGELNDLVTNDAIDMMALFYHLTGETRYLQAMKRVGDWLLEAQGKRVPLWADQYDAANRPAWGRHFEPPAYGASATGMAVEALREMYRFSGDKRYLEGIRRASEWIAVNLPEGQISSFTDPESGRAIAAWERKVYFLDDPESAEFLKAVPFGSSYLSKSNIGATVTRTLQQAEAGPPARVLLTAEAARASLPARRASARSNMDLLNEAGVWTVPVVANYLGSLGEGFGADLPRTAPMIGYVEAARLALGELTPRYPGGSSLLSLAYPFPDWYGVKWAETLGK
jgi:hypothetical protein